MNATATLTKRETEIAELIAWGSTKKDVAKRLSISTRTVENIARSIFFKTKVTKSNELSAWWFCKKYRIPITESPLIKKASDYCQRVKIFKQRQHEKNNYRHLLVYQPLPFMR